MQKREIKDAITEMSNKLFSRISVVAQDLITKDTRENGEFLQRKLFDNEFDLPRSLFHVILCKVVEEFAVKNKNVEGTLVKVKDYLGVTDVERKRPGKPEEANTEAT